MADNNATINSLFRNFSFLRLHIGRLRTLRIRSIGLSTAAAIAYHHADGRNTWTPSGDFNYWREH